MAPAVTAPITEKTRARTSHFRQDMLHPRHEEGSRNKNSDGPWGPSLQSGRDSTRKGLIRSTQNRRWDRRLPGQEESDQPYTDYAWKDRRDGGPPYHLVSWERRHMI